MHKVKSVLIILSILSCCLKVCAQNYPVYSSYYVNPYLYNPAEAATEYTYVFLNHRQQWTGIEGSPKLTTINFNTLLNESRAGIGIKASNYTRGILSTTDLSLTYVYSVSLNEKNTIFFGLSAGAISNDIDLDQVDDPSDPAIAGYLANNIQPAANFGFLYRSASGINFGVSLPQLFEPAFNSTSHFENTSVAPLDNIIVSAYYKKKVDGKVVSRKRRGMRRKIKTGDSYAPLEFYTMYKYAAAGNSQAEALIKLNLSDNFWVAGGYRLEYGFGANIGFALNKFLLSYSYEPGNQPEPGFSTGTHEIQLGLKLGEPKKYKKVAPVLRSQIQRTGNEQHLARFQQTIEDPDNVGHEEASKRKYYVVIRSFADFGSADAYKKKLIDEKFNADIFYYDKDKKFHVHVLESTKSSDAYEEARNLKAYTKLKDARVLVVTDSK